MIPTLSCKDAQDLQGKHSQKHFTSVFNHLLRCNECKPIDFVIALRRRMEKYPKKFKSGSPGVTTSRWVARVYKRFGHIDKQLQKECAWFIVHNYSYDLKVELSWALTTEQTIDAIFHHVNEISSRAYLYPDMKWPTSSYRNKFRAYNNFRESVTQQEQNNDSLFEKACLLNKKDLIGVPREDFYKFLDIAGVLNG